MAGFIQLMRSETAEELLAYPTGFVLLTQIALRARRELPKINPYQMQIGEAMIGDFTSLGLTRQQFRTALDQLIKWKYVTIRTTNKGTIAKLTNTDVYNINAGADQPTSQPANNQQTNQQTNQPTTTKNKVNKERMEEGVVCPLPESNLFEAFWLAYPRKESKKTARLAFSKLKPHEQSNAANWAALWFGRKKPADWVGSNGQDIRPHPTTWLNQARWTDLFEVAETNPGLLPTAPTPDSELPARGGERPGQLIVIRGVPGDASMNRMKIDAAKRNWPTATIHALCTT